MLHLTTLAILFFFLSLSFLTQNSQFLLMVSLKSNLNWPRSEMVSFCKITRLLSRETLLQGIKIFTQNNFIISIVLIWYLPLVDLLSFFLVLMLNIWLQRLSFSRIWGIKNSQFSYPQDTMVSVREIRKTVSPQKISGYSPAFSWLNSVFHFFPSERFVLTTHSNVNISNKWLSKDFYNVIAWWSSRNFAMMVRNKRTIK